MDIATIRPLCRSPGPSVLGAGCQPVVAGDLASARRFQRGGAGLRAHQTAPELRRSLGLS